MKRIILLVLVSLSLHGYTQYKWKPEKSENGINVFSSDVPNSSFKAIKVECNLAGNYTKLIRILSDVSQFSNWIYHSKSCKLLQKNSASDFIYHAETSVPWPMSNRDAVIHIRINTDSLPRFITITGTGEPNRIPKTSGLIRVVHYFAKWKITAISPQMLSIHYEVELDPGGSIPGWMSNMFAGKGPFETFSNLAKKLKE